MAPRVTHYETGVTLLELLVSMSLLSAMMGLAVVKLKEFARPSKTSLELVASHMKSVRSYAISNTLAIELYAVGSSRLAARSASSCNSSSWTQVESLFMDLPEESKLATTGWAVCFSPRGFPDGLLTISIEDYTGEQGSLELMLGGGVREL